MANRTFFICRHCGKMSGIDEVKTISHEALFQIRKTFLEKGERSLVEAFNKLLKLSAEYNPINMLEQYDLLMLMGQVPRRAFTLGVQEYIDGSHYRTKGVAYLKAIIYNLANPKQQEYEKHIIGSVPERKV